MRIYLEDCDGTAHESDSLEGVTLADCQQLWVDSVSPTPAELEELASFFSLHPVAIDSYLEADELPRMTEFPEHLFVVWHFLRDDPATEVVEAVGVFAFLGDNFLLTLHHQDCDEIDGIYQKLRQDPEIYRHRPAVLLYSILDTGVDEYFPIVEDLTNRIDAFQEEVLSSGSTGDIRVIMALKHRNMALRRNASAHRDVVLKLSRRDTPYVPEDLSLYLLDVFDHLVRIGSEVDNNSDLITSSLDIHLSMVSNRLNEVMKKFTIVATIFLPLTFLAGVWGMNFRRMPELYWEHGYVFAWATLLVAAIVMTIIAVLITREPRSKVKPPKGDGR